MKRVKIFTNPKPDGGQLWVSLCHTCKNYKRNATYRYYCEKELNPINCNSHETKT